MRLRLLQPQQPAIPLLPSALLLIGAAFGLGACGDDDSGGDGAHIIVEVTTSGEGADQQFEFDTDYEEEAFSLAPGEQHDSGDLEPGEHRVAQRPVDGWLPATATCTRDQDPEHLELGNGETITCTFENRPIGTPEPGAIVVKNIAEGAGSTVFGFEAGPDIATFNLGNGETHEMSGLVPGIYSVRLTGSPGFHQQSAACDNGDPPDAITLAADATVLCIFTSVEDVTPPPGSGRVVVLQVAKDHSAQQFTFTASYASSSFTLSDGQTHDSGPLTPGTYSVAQAPLAGWATSVNCTDGSDGASISLAANQTVTCTFTSVLEPPAKVIVVQVTDPSDEKYAFPYETSYAPGGFALASGYKDTSGDLSAGTYSVKQQVPVGWAATSQCSNGADPGSLSLSAGETVTCTFTTTKLGPGERQVHFTYISSDTTCTKATFTTSAPEKVIELTLESVVAGKYTFSGTVPAGTPTGMGALHVKCAGGDSWSPAAI